jgi:tRNA A-37 threonylcarbamoyl transferase component Bud32
MANRGDLPPNGSESDNTVNLHGPAHPSESTDFEIISDTPESLGDFDLLEEIGAGGMGRVFKARQRSRGRVVALKTLLPRYVATPGLVQRLRKEAEAAGQLNHPGIVPVYGIDKAGGHVFFTMPLIEGRALDERLSQGPLDNRRAALIVQRVAEAVAYAHRMGVIHRDLKPGNILLDRDGGVKVTDFGLARRLDVQDMDATDASVRAAHPVTVGSVFQQTQAGVVMGTPGYMAPEQAIATGNVGPAADVWALGAVLYACLTGRPPFVGAHALETLSMTVESPPVPPDEINPDADRDLVEICLKCLRKETADRYASADQVAEDLAQWREGRLARSRGEVWQARLARFLARSPELVPLMTGLIVNRLGNSQEAIFVGCAVAAIPLASRRNEPKILIWAGIASVIFVLCVLVGGWATSDGARLAGAVDSAAALVAAAVTIGCAQATFATDRVGAWSPKRLIINCLWGGVAALAFSLVAALGVDRLHDLDPMWANAATILERVLGRISAWVLAVPLGISVGLLFGRVNQMLDRLGREPIAAFAIGAALLAFLSSWALNELQPQSITQSARFSSLGGGPALSIAENMLARWPGPAVEPRRFAAMGAFWMKLLLFVVPMLLGGLLFGTVARVSDRRVK